MSSETEDIFPNLWQDRGRVGGKVCIRGTRYPIHSIGYRLDDFIKAIPQEEWEEEFDRPEYSKDAIIQAIHYMCHFFYVVGFDLSDPVTVLGLKILDERRCNQPSPIKDTEPVPIFPWEHGVDLDLTDELQRIVPLLEEMLPAVKEKTEQRLLERCYSVDDGTYDENGVLNIKYCNHAEYLEWKKEHPTKGVSWDYGWEGRKNLLKMAFELPTVDAELGGSWEKELNRYLHPEKIRKELGLYDE